MLETCDFSVSIWACSGFRSVQPARAATAARAAILAMTGVFIFVVL